MSPIHFFRAIKIIPITNAGTLPNDAIINTEESKSPKAIMIMKTIANTPSAMEMVANVFVL